MERSRVVLSLQQHRHLSLPLFWQEYRRARSEGYRYSVLGANSILCGSNTKSATGSVDSSSTFTRWNLSVGTDPDRTRQYENGGDSRLPLRSGLNPTLSRVRDALRDGSGAGAAVTNHAITQIAPVAGTPRKWYLNPHQSATNSCFGAVESIH